MKVNEIRKIETDTLEKKIVELKKELYELHFQQATGQLSNTARLKQIRKTVARMKTIITERALAGKEN